jgi:WhiB family redox-sensing transcriptional regulator
MGVRADLMTPVLFPRRSPVSESSMVGSHADDVVLLDLIADEAMEWQERALCAQTDPEAFFPEKGGSTREAKRVCLSCEVRVECLEYALANDERFGIWGGLSERERRRLKKQAV